MSTTQEIVGITQTVRRALQDSGYGSYMAYASPVIGALIDRETALADLLVDYAVDAGADVTEVQAYLREIGMITAHADEETTSSAEPEDILTRIDARLNSLVEKVDDLAQFARANGYRG